LCWFLQLQKCPMVATRLGITYNIEKVWE